MNWSYFTISVPNLSNLLTFSALIYMPHSVIGSCRDIKNNANVNVNMVF